MERDCQHGLYKAGMGSSRVLSDFAEKYGSKNRVLAGFGIGGKSGKEKHGGPEESGVKDLFGCEVLHLDVPRRVNFAMTFDYALSTSIPFFEILWPGQCPSLTIKMARLQLDYVGVSHLLKLWSKRVRPRVLERFPKIREVGYEEKTEGLVLAREQSTGATMGSKNGVVIGSRNPTGRLDGCGTLVSKKGALGLVTRGSSLGLVTVLPGSVPDPEVEAVQELELEQKLVLLVKSNACRTISF
ncbi:hypothetical protein Tco_1042103 [Tanacetum coccineum]|uniref:Uncharacterized protein n=1 Tax=Tanacetum coccineum TaxID=301880 RepID=A0ABQ5GIW2_9ASTR